MSQQHDLASYFAHSHPTFHMAFARYNILPTHRCLFCSNVYNTCRHGDRQQRNQGDSAGWFNIVFAKFEYCAHDERVILCSEWAEYAHLPRLLYARALGTDTILILFFSSIPKSTLYYSSFSLLLILSLLWVVSQATQITIPQFLNHLLLSLPIILSLLWVVSQVTQIIHMYQCVGNWQHSPLWQP